MPLSERQPSTDLRTTRRLSPNPMTATGTHRSARARGNARVERIDVKAKVHGEGTPRVDMVERHLDDAADAPLVDLVHRERLDAVLLEQAFLARVDVAQADIHELVR